MTNFVDNFRKENNNEDNKDFTYSWCLLPLSILSFFTGLDFILPDMVIVMRNGTTGQ